jgi:hypothetical protein
MDTINAFQNNKLNDYIASSLNITSNNIRISARTNSNKNALVKPN